MPGNQGSLAGRGWIVTGQAREWDLRAGFRHDVHVVYLYMEPVEALAWTGRWMGVRWRTCRDCSLPRPCRPKSSHIVPAVLGTTNKFVGPKE